jgi:hypothetical protein
MNVSDQNTKREQGRKVQLGNVSAAKVSQNTLTFFALEAAIAFACSYSKLREGI